ncbi:hypothetical protein HDU96_001118 [Phlyctochytrium bullatum]|nr:hypothetical protein HDU96_001118 [Phlyctochytrium bullatum]
MSNTRIVPASNITNLAYARDIISIARSFPLIFLMVSNVKVFLMVKWKRAGDFIHIWTTTCILWACINVPWYVAVQMGRATGDPEIRATGQLLVFITFFIYTILALSSEFMCIKMIWEIAANRDSRPFHWILNVSELFLYISIISFGMGNVSRLLQYLVAKSLVVGPTYSQIISVLSGDIAEAPFMLAMTFCMVVLTRGLAKSDISFLKHYDGGASSGAGTMSTVVGSRVDEKVGGVSRTNSVVASSVMASSVVGAAGRLGVDRKVSVDRKPSVSKTLEEGRN